MLTYKTGCLIEAVRNGEVDVIAHQANCFNTMNSGIAKAIRINFPEMYAADCETDKGDPEKLGSCTFADLTGYDVLGFNLYGQFRYGTDRQYTNYEALESALETMAEVLEGFDPSIRIGIPKLGCGHGGGDFNIVRQLVEKHLGKWNVIVYELYRGTE